MPLSKYGLCEAVISIPIASSESFLERIKDREGVGNNPRLIIS